MKLRALIAALILPGALLAQSRVTVPVQDPVYRDLDRFIALRLVEVGLYGQRPYSRREIARMLADARVAAAARPTSPVTRRSLDRALIRFAPELRERATDSLPGRRWRNEIAGGLLGISSDRRAIPDDATGEVDATIEPLLDGRSGRRFAKGTNWALEGEHEFRAWRNLALLLRPRGVAAWDSTGVSAFGTVEGASTVLGIRNVTIEAGRQQLVWGQGMEGGFVATSSGRPLDAVRFSTDLPFRGWFLKGTHPMRGSLIAADLGGRQTFPHSILIAYKLSGHPFSNRIELAASVLSIQGGRGAPRGSFGDHVMDVIPALKYLLPDNTTQFSNKLAGWEYRLRVPEWSGLQLYAEHAFDDMDPRRWKSTFWEEAGHILGASMTDLGPDGGVSAAWELHHTGLRYYKHGVFRSGITFNGTLIGSPLGNQANASYLRVSWDRTQEESHTVDLAVERRDGDAYATTSQGPKEDNFRFIKLQNVPAEWRSRVSWTWAIDRRHGRAALRGAYELVRNFAFGDGDTRHHFTIGVDVTQRP